MRQCSKKYIIKKIIKIKKEYIIENNLNYKNIELFKFNSYYKSAFEELINFVLEYKYDNGIKAIEEFIRITDDLCTDTNNIEKRLLFKTYNDASNLVYDSIF